MKVEFLSNEDKHTRLEGTICRYKGVPCSVTTRPITRHEPSLTPDEIYVLPMGSENKSTSYIKVKCSDPDFDASAPELGYINYNKTTDYAYRKPLRQYAAGLPVSHIEWVCKRFHECGIYSHGPIFDCISNKYPDFQEALTKIVLGDKGCAFHKKLAIIEVNRYNLGLEYMGDLIGLCPRVGERMKFKIMPRRGFKIIEPLLQEQRVPYEYDDQRTLS